MLTRLKICGFKSLRDCEIYFGPFTCIAGPNGVGKSNLFDAMLFMRDLTNTSLVEAAARVRDPSGRSGDIRNIFTNMGANTSAPSILMEADLIVPRNVTDDFGRETETKSTSLRYTIEIGLRIDPKTGHDKLELLREELIHVTHEEVKDNLHFKYEKKFLKSILHGRKTTKLISTEPSENGNTIVLHQDGVSGLPYKIPGATSPRTMLSSVNTNSHPTVLSAKREMQLWNLLQLEPSALRQPDNFSDEGTVSSNGAHLPNAILRMSNMPHVLQYLSELLPDVRNIYVDGDEGRRTNTLYVEGGDGVSYPARALSDGTLRFLALSVIAADTETGRVICLEEPENGIHPSRVSSVVRLLRSISVDPTHAIDSDNPLRQVIINTHSPLVVSALDVDELLLAKAVRRGGHSYSDFFFLEGSTREKRTPSKPSKVVGRGDVIGYLEGNKSHDGIGSDPLIRKVWDFAYEQQPLDLAGDSQ